MPQIFQEESAGGRLGSSLGTGLQNLANFKLNQLAQQQALARTQQGLSSLFSPQQAQALSALPNELLAPIIKQQLQAPSNAAYLQGIQALLGGEQIAPQSQTLQQPSQQISGSLNIQPGLNAQQATKLAELGLKAKKQQAAERTEARVSAKEVREFTAPYVKMAEGAEDRIRNYNLAIKGAQSGNIRPGYVNQILDKIGLHGLGQNPTQAVLDKSLSTLGLDAASAFGSGTRLTNYLEQTFQRTLPSLHNEPAAIVGISKIKILEEEMKKLPEQAAKELIKQWKGVLPEDAELQLRDKIKDRKAEIEQQVYKEANNLNALASGLGEEQDTLPAPEANVKYYVSDLGTNVFSPDGKSYIREDNGQPFDWQAYNQGAR